MAIPGLSNDPIEVDTVEWIDHVQAVWRQGEHVALIGQTGTGKTTLARYLLTARDYVVVLAVKRNDDTLATFRKPWRENLSGESITSPNERDLGQIVEPAYKIIKKWPPNYNENKVIVWFKPEHLRDTGDQSAKLYDVLDHIFRDGGWAVFIDDTGYTTGILGLGRDIAVLLNQARSSHVSVVTAMTQPSSFVARIPSETLRQVRHVIAFRYKDMPSIEAIARLTGEDKNDVKAWLSELDAHDFLAWHHGDVFLVRNTRAE